MRKMSKHEDWEALERQVLSWLDIRKIPLEDYRNLSSFDNVYLSNPKVLVVVKRDMLFR